MPVAASARWDAARRLYEGEAATAELIAAACGWTATRLRNRAQAEAWRARRYARKPHERLAPLVEKLTAQAAAIGGSGDKPLSSGEVGALNALLKTIQTMGDMTGGAAAAEDRRERARQNDERLAAVLARIDDRIEELAKVHAREMLRKGWTGEGGE